MASSYLEVPELLSAAKLSESVTTQRNGINTLWNNNILLFQWLCMKLLGVGSVSFPWRK